MRRKWASVAMVAALALATQTAGCSFIGVRGPPSRPIDRYAEVRCTRSRAAPAVDLLAGGAAVILGISGLTASSGCESSGEWCFDFSGLAHAMGAVFLGIGGLAVASGVYGFAKTNDCREVIDTQSACRGGDEEACGRLVALPGTQSSRR